MVIRKNTIDEFQSFIFSWWKENKRDLPWRHTHDPYRIIVSEIMLQQTQVSRVLVKYGEFLHEFPSVHSLAEASVSNVLRIWKGMGYNRRALYLKRMAEKIVSDYDGVFPKTEKELVQLPGVGTYTARAVCIFAYRQDIATVDTNIRRIITHVFFDDIPQTPQVIEETAQQLVPIGRSWEWHQALMDYGAIALGKIPLKEGITKTQPIPFKKTDRFVRGKIIDRLRAGSVRRSTLIHDISQFCGRDKNSVGRILKTLCAEGLLQIDNGNCALPD